MMFFYTRKIVDRMTAHYEAEIAWLRSEARYHLLRADRALDALTTVASNRPVVTALPAQPPEDETTKMLADLTANQEFNAVGDVNA